MICRFNIISKIKTGSNLDPVSKSKIMSNKIEHIKIKNFKGIDQIDANIHSANVYVVGGNGRGKTSFIDAIWTGLTGKNIPDVPIRQGENESVIEITLDKYVAMLEFKRKRDNSVKQTFRLFSKDDGTEIQSPRTFMNQIVGIIDFDPTHFFTLSSEKQIEYFCKITGLNVAEIENEYSELYQERTFRNKTMKQLSDGSVWFDQEIANRELVDVKTLYEQKTTEKEKQLNFNRVSSGITERQAKIDEMKKQISELQTQIDSGIQWIEKPENQPMSSDQIAMIDQQIANVEKTNAEITEHKTAKINSEKLKIAENAIVEIENEIAANRDKKKKLLMSKIEIPGLTFDGICFLYNGLPFEKNQINTADQLIAGLHIGKSLLKDVRILKFDGSLVDQNNIKMIENWATENDVQLFIELVDRTGGKLEIKIDQE